MCAAQCLGGIPVPLYQDAVAAEMAFPIQNAEIALRGRRGPGAGRQAARDPAAVPDARAHLLRRSARPAPLRRSRSSMSYDSAARARRAKRSGAIRRSSRPRSPRARAATPRRCSSPRARPGTPKGVVLTHHSLIDRARAAAEMEGLSDARRGARLPAAGLDRPEHLFLRAALRHRLLHLLPGVGRDGDERHARDRPDLLLRAAARARGAAHPGVDPHGGRERAQALAVPLLHGRRAPRRRRDPRRQAGRRSSTGCCTGSATCWSTGRCATCSA